MAFAHQGLGGAGGDERALDGQDHRRARVKINAVVGLAERQGDGGHRGGGLLWSPEEGAVRGYRII